MLTGRHNIVYQCKKWSTPIDHLEFFHSLLAVGHVGMGMMADLYQTSLMVSLDCQHSCHVPWNLVMAGNDFLVLMADETQTEHHNNDDLQNRQQHNHVH